MSRKTIIYPLVAVTALVLGGLVTKRVNAQQEIEKRFEQLDGNGEITKKEATRSALRGRLKNLIGKIAERKNDNDEVVPAVPAKSMEAPIRQGPKLLTPGEHGIGRFVPDLEFLDLGGVPRKLHGSDANDLTVIAFTSTSCPLSKKYLPTLVELHRDFSTRGVRILLVNCVATDKFEEMKSAVSRFSSDVEYTFDKDSKIGFHLSALSTTDVFILDRSHTIVYHGAIDDQYGFGYSLDAPRYTYLRDALEATLDRRSVLVSATAAPGCLLEKKPIETLLSDVTYHNQISRLLQRHCVECHREGGVGPFALESSNLSFQGSASILLFKVFSFSWKAFLISWSS